MAKILSKVLTHFGWVWKNDSGFQAPDKIDLSGVLQPVADVSALAAREAARLAHLPGGTGGTQRVGQFSWALQIVGAGAGTSQTSFTISENALRTLGYLVNLRDNDLYLWGISAWGNNAFGTFTMALMNRTSPAGNGPAVASEYIPLWYSASPIDITAAIAGVVPYTPSFVIPQPILVPEFSTLYSIQKRTGGHTTNMFFHMELRAK